MKENVLKKINELVTKKSIKAIVFTQATIRMIISARKAAHVIQAKDRINDLIDKGKIRNSSNVNVLSALKEQVRYCLDDLHMNDKLEAAHNLITRLEQVQGYVDKMNDLISNANNIDDIVEKYESLLDILHAATAVEIRVSQMQEILKIVENLKDRAQMVVTLRLARKHGDDDLLSACLNEIRILSQTHGPFCQKDEEIGREYLKILQEDNTISDKCLSIMQAVRNSQDLQSSITLKKVSKNMDEEFNVAYNKVLVLLEPYKQQPPKSLFMIDLINVFETIVKLRSANSSQRWSSVVENAQSLRQYLNSLEMMNATASDSLKSRCDNLSKIAKAELFGISKNLEENYVVIELIRLTEQFDQNLCTDENYREDLKNCLTNIKSTGCQWGYEVNTLLSRLNILSLAFGSEKEEHWDDILSLTESSSDTKARRARRMKLQERFHDEVESGLLDRLNDAIFQPPSTCVILKSFKLTLSQIRDASLRAIGQKVEHQLAKIRENAINKYALVMLIFAITVGKVKGTGGEISVSDAKVDCIEAVMAELYLMSLADTNDTISDEIKTVRDLVEILCVIRTNLINNEWQKVVDFHPVANIRILQKEFSPANFSTMALECIMDVKNEIGWIILGAKNIVTYNTLITAISSNILTGTIDYINTDNINTKVIEDCLLMCEKCQEGEYSGISSKLEALVIFSGSLMNARNAFVSYTNPVDRESYVTELDEIDTSFLESKDIKDEVLLMYAGTFYSQCKKIYDELLSEHLIKPYFINDDSLSYPEEEGLDLSNPSNLLLAHKLKLSPIVQDPTPLTNLLEKSISLKNEKFFGLLPPSFVLEMNLCQRIFDFILLIKESKWSEAIKAVNNLVHEDLDDDAINQMDSITECAAYESHFDPILTNLNNTVTIINDFNLLTTCVDALYGPTKYELDSILKQLESVKKSEPVQILYNSMIKINALRVAVQNDNWDDIGNILKEINDSKIGRGLTVISRQEIEIIDANYHNRKAEKLLIDALLSEVLVEDDGLVNINKINISKLTDALSIATNNSNELKSVILMKLQTAAEISLIVRSKLSQNRKDATDNLLEEYQTKVIAVQSHLNISASIYSKVNKNRHNFGSSSPIRSPRNSLTGITGGILYTPEKSAKLVNYVPVINILLKEIELIRKHKRISDYQEEILNVFKDGGLYEGNSIDEVDVDSINISNIDDVIHKKTKIQQEYAQIPQSINDIVEGAKLVSSLRVALKEKNYSLMLTVYDSIQQLPLSSYPEKLHIELQVIKNIIDNNTIITTMKDELQRGKLAGVVGQVLSGNVSFVSMTQKANDCKSLNPRTNEAKTLIKTAELMIPIRKLLCANPVDWKEVRQCADNLIVDNTTLEIHPLVLPELILISAHASDSLLCKRLEDALEKDGPTGIVGEMIIDSINVDALTSAHAFTNSYSTLSEKALQLKLASEITINIRSLLLQTKDYPIYELKDIHKSIYNEIDKGNDLLAKSSWNSYSFLPFKQELIFIKNHCNTIDIEILIEECIYSSSYIYLNRHNSTDEYLQTSDSTMLSCNDLQAALEVCQSYKFQCIRLDILMQCLKSLIQLRSALISGHWNQVKLLLADERLKNCLEQIPSSKTEYQWIEIEYRNHSVLVVLQSVFIYLEGVDITNIPFSENNDLIRSIEIATNTTNLSAFVSNTLLCSKCVLLLNEGISEHDDDKVNNAFIWLATNSLICIPSVKVYVDKVQKFLQNELLLSGLTKVLSRGRVTGAVGNLNHSTIETIELGAYLQQALTLTSKERREEVDNVIEIAEAIFLLRESQLKDDIIGVKNAIELIGDKRKIPEFVIDEIAIAQSEIDNMLTYLALTEAIEDFDTDTTKAIEIALYHVYNDIGMINNEDISSSLLLPIQLLQDAIDVARNKGILSNETRNLFRKATLILSIRKAINSDDWTSVEELTSYTDFQQNYSNHIDDVDTIELNMVKSQLMIRSKVTEIIKRITSGRAECIDGYVDIRALSIDGLDLLINDIETLITVTNEQLESSTSTVLRFTFSLLESAKIIDNIRKLLKQKDHKAAGILSDMALQNNNCLDIIKPELLLYSVEISEVIQRNHLSELLREYANIADPLKLRMIINDAKEFASKHKCELGFLHSIDKANATYIAIIESIVSLRSSLSLYDILKVKNIIKKASLLKISGCEYNDANDHLKRMTEFEALAIDMKNSNVGSFLYKTINDLATSLGMEKHPLALRSKLILSLNEKSIPSVIIAESVECGAQDLAASETMKWKRLYLDLESSKRLYVLQNFPALRDSSMYANRMSIESKELRNSMLLHTDTCIPTSLTKQSPIIAALSVWIFGNIIIGIENNMYSNPEVLLKNLIKLCQTFPIIRDEVILQILKQLNNNNNNNDDRCDRLWRTLATCLMYFPPSKDFENYLESFLMTEITAKSKANAEACIRLMHRSIYKYGYDKSNNNGEILISVKDSLINNTILKSMNNKADIHHNSYNTMTNFYLRGTKLNWNNRFSLLQKAVKTKSTSGNHITKNDFEENMNRNILIDIIDKEILLYLITGVLPHHISRQALENNAHKYIYIYDNNDSKKASDERVSWLVRNMQIPDHNPEQQISEMNSIFWEFIIEKCNAFFNLESGILSIDVYRDIILAGQKVCVKVSIDKKTKQKNIML